MTLLIDIALAFLPLLILLLAFASPLTARPDPAAPHENGVDETAVRRDIEVPFRR